MEDTKKIDFLNIAGPTHIQIHRDSLLRYASDRVPALRGKVDTIPSLDQKLCLTDKYSLMKNRFSPTSVTLSRQPTLRAAPCPTGDSQHKIYIMASLENVSQGFDTHFI